MKKTIYFLTMILALALMSTSCEKEPFTPELEILYPEWADLTWICTESDTSSNVYPKLHVVIDNNTATIKQELSTGDNIGVFTSMTLTDVEDDGYVSGIVTFSNNSLTLVAEFVITYDARYPDIYYWDSHDYLVLYPLSGFEQEILDVDDIRFRMN